MEQSEDRVTNEPNSEEQPVRYAGKTQQQWKHYWDQELEAEGKRNREYRKMADSINRRYLDKRKDQGPQYNIGSAEFRVNLFHSNTFTVLAFLYGRVPLVDAARRFSDANDDVGRVAANILERLVNTSIQDNVEDFNSVMRGDLEDYLVPGMGVARVRYEFEEEEREVPPTTEFKGGMPISIPGYTEKVLVHEEAPVDYIHWRDFRWGYGRRWSDIDWISFDVYLTKEEATTRFGPEKARRLTYRRRKVTDPEMDTTSQDVADTEETALITEIECKKANSIFWYHKDYEGILDIKEDPLGLEGFFSAPKPMVANNSTTLFQPQPFFMLAQDLYNEVDQLSTRINIITNAVKVVGVYDKTHKELGTMLQGSVENDMVPVDNYAMLGEKGGLKGVLDFWPVEDIVTTLDKLREMRRETIDLLYQVTGVADILRGGGEKYEGVGRAELKAKFGGVRIQYLQEEFARFGSDLLTLRAEVMCKHFDDQTILQNSNITYSYDAMGYNDQGPLIPQAIQMLRDYDQSKWRVEIKPESMAMIDWTQIKMDRTEFLNALATYLQSMQPIATEIQGSMPFLLELLKWGLSGFKGGEEIESVLDAAIEQAKKAPPQQEGEGDGKAAAEMMKSRAKMAENDQKFRQDMAKQADKARKEMEKMLAQFQLQLQTIQAETQSQVIQEVVQADQGIREKKATQNKTLQ